jgi:hypothetical protein
MILRPGAFSSSNRNSKREILSAVICYFARCNLCVGNDFIVKPFLKRIGDLYGSKDSIGKPVLAIFFFFDSFFLCYRSNWYSCPLVPL